MTNRDEIWNAHQRKAEQALVEARFLFEAGKFDGACVLALNSCLQIARSVAIRIGRAQDPQEWAYAIRKMTKDGRLPESLMGPISQIVKAHAEEISTSRPCDAVRATEVIKMTETFHRLMVSAADLTVSMQSPKVRQAMAARGMPIGMPF